VDVSMSRFPFASRRNVQPSAATPYGCSTDTGTSFGEKEAPNSLRSDTWRAPSGILSPRLVKIWTTPFAASDPYREEAAAPFTTSIRSMSSALMSASVPRVIVPSTMINGSCVPVMLVAARRRIFVSDPGWPLG